MAETTADGPKARDILSQIAHHLQEIGYTKTLKALEKEGKNHGLEIDANGWGELASRRVDPITLVAFWADVHASHYPSLDQPDSESSADDSDDSEEEEDPDEEAGGAELVDIEAEETSDDSSDEDSDSSASSAKAGQKRKRQFTPDSSSDSSSDSSGPDSDVNVEKPVASDSSDSDSDSDSSSSESDHRPAKRTKVSSKKSSRSSSSDSDSSSPGGSDSEGSKSSSSSDSDSGSGSGSDSRSSSSSDSDSSSDSESSRSPSPPPKKKKQTKAAKGKLHPAIGSKLATETGTGSASSSSATLRAESPPQSKKAKGTDTLVIDDGEGWKELPATKANVKKLKKEQVPFSRIPADTKVDPRFASNAYVPYDYAERAHRDLIVTKGKGFTKEKNKKKRGEHSTNTSRKQKPVRHAEWDSDGWDEDLMPDYDDLEYNLVRLKDDLSEFHDGCGFDPLSGGW